MKFNAKITLIYWIARCYNHTLTFDRVTDIASRFSYDQLNRIFNKVRKDMYENK